MSKINTDKIIDEINSKYDELEKLKKKLHQKNKKKKKKKEEKTPVLTKKKENNNNEKVVNEHVNKVPEEQKEIVREYTWSNNKEGDTSKTRLEEDELKILEKQQEMIQERIKKAKEQKKKQQETQKITQGYSKKKVIFFIGLTALIITTFFMSYMSGQVSGYVEAMNEITISYDTFNNTSATCVNFPEYPDQPVCFETI